MDQAGLGLPYATLMNSTTNSTKTLMEAYAAYMTDTAKLIRNHIKGGTNDSTIENDVEQVIQFQIDLAKVFITLYLLFNKLVKHILKIDSNSAGRATE